MSTVTLLCPTPGGGDDGRSPRGAATHGGLRGTVSTHLARLARRTCLQAGVARWEIAAPGLDDVTLADDLLRVPTSSMARLWRLVGRAEAHGGLRMAESAPRGTLHAWDYLFGTGPDLEAGCRRAARYLHTVDDPAARMEVAGDGRLLTIRFRLVATDPEAARTAAECFLSLVLRRIRESGDGSETPVRVAFAHRAPAHHRVLADHFGTRNVEFGGPGTSLTFLAPPVGRASGPRLDAELTRILSRYAEAVAVKAKPAPDWRQRFRDCVTESMYQGSPTLEWVAEQLAVSTRTLQRRLAEHHTSWREEVDRVRHAQAVRLLRDTDLSIRSIAVRLGYADARALRRAFQRWTGDAPDSFRRREGGTRAAARTP